MGRLRSALRAYALEHADPGEVLSLLDTKLHVFEDEAMATVLYAVTGPPFTEVRMSSAGHLAPLLAAQDERTVELVLEPDPPLGVDAGVARPRVYDGPWAPSPTSRPTGPVRACSTRRCPTSRWCRTTSPCWSPVRRPGPADADAVRRGGAHLRRDLIAQG